MAFGESSAIKTVGWFPVPYWRIGFFRMETVGPRILFFSGWQQDKTGQLFDGECERKAPWYFCNVQIAAAFIV